MPPSVPDGRGYFEIVTSSDLLKFAEIINEEILANNIASMDAVLRNNIDLTDVNWTAMCQDSDGTPYSYTGTFNGAGYTVNLKTTLSENDNYFYHGLFTQLGAGGLVKDLVLSADFNLSTTQYCGVVAENLKGGTIEGVVVNGSITGGYRLGGIVARVSAAGSKISNCVNNADISGSSNYIGGIAALIIGSNSNLIMEYCANRGKISNQNETFGANFYTGGLMGNASGSIISNSYNAGEVSTPNWGFASPNPIAGFFNRIGGLIGGNGNNQPIIKNSFNYGKVTLKGEPGAVISGNLAVTNTALPILSNDFYLDGSGGMLFGAARSDALTHAALGSPANGEDGWGSDAIKALISGKTEEEFKDGYLVALLNAGPDSTVDGVAQWTQGKYYPELIDFFVEWTPPELTIGEVRRASVSEAEVTFTSDEDGWLYYAVAEHGAEAPDIGTTGDGTPMTAGEDITITLNNLTDDGAYDLHIKAKDTVGNVSALVITIPAYAPTITPGGEETATKDEEIITKDEETTSKDEGTTITKDGGTVTITPSGTVNNGNQTVTVTANALIEAIADAGSGSGGNPVTLEIKAAALTGQDAETVKSSSAAIDIKGLREVAESGAVEKLKVSSPIGEITLDKSAIKSVLSAAADGAVSVDIVAERVEDAEDDKNLPAPQREALEDEKFLEVYDISIFINNEKVKDFETDGKLTIGLPYELKDGESGEYVWAYHVAEDGGTERMEKGRHYDTAKNLAVFDTNHLSIYALSYHESVESSGGCSMGAAGIIAMMLLAAAIRARRGKD
ncbi:MAG: hypothetical protein LBU13_06085 [Synergistaceae bacterium]|nr:hypothetical protein [Synergistaceae bacterium]